MARRFAKAAGQQDQALCIGPRTLGAGGYAQKNPLALARRHRSRACQLCTASSPPAAAPLPLRIRHRHGGRTCAPHTSIRSVRVPYSHGATPLIPCAAAEGGRLKGAKGPAAPMPPIPRHGRRRLRVARLPGQWQGGRPRGPIRTNAEPRVQPQYRKVSRRQAGKAAQSEAPFSFFCRRRPPSLHPTGGRGGARGGPGAKISHAAARLVAAREAPCARGARGARGDRRRCGRRYAPGAGRGPAAGPRVFA